MNYHAFAIPVRGFLIDNKLRPSQFARMLTVRRGAFPPPVANAMQNLVDSRDTDPLASMIVNSDLAVYQNPLQPIYDTANSARSNSRYKIRKPNNRERAIQRMVVLFQMTYPGAPMIYYGDEAGMWGGDDPDCRLPMVWADMKFDPQSRDPRGAPRKQSDDVGFNAGLFAFYKRAIALRQAHPPCAAAASAL
jgi:cyclomaltodextrinase / maltogenic alpha-amylase / neopullulanase